LGKGQQKEVGLWCEYAENVYGKATPAVRGGGKFAVKRLIPHDCRRKAKEGSQQQEKKNQKKKRPKKKKKKTPTKEGWGAATEMLVNDQKRNFPCEKVQNLFVGAREKNIPESIERVNP